MVEVILSLESRVAGEGWYVFTSSFVSDEVLTNFVALISSHDCVILKSAWHRCQFLVPSVFGSGEFHCETRYAHPGSETWRRGGFDLPTCAERKESVGMRFVLFS